MHIKADDVLVVHLVVVWKVRALEVKNGAESLYRQVSKSRGKLYGRDSLFFFALMRVAEGTGDFLRTGVGVGIVAASIARSSSSSSSISVSWDPRETDKAIEAV